MNIKDGGMTLRDYFAAHGPSDEDLSGAVTTAEAANIAGVEVKDYSGALHWPKVRAFLLYRHADAMIAARDPKQDAAGKPCPNTSGEFKACPHCGFTDHHGPCFKPAAQPSAEEKP